MIKFILICALCIVVVWTLDRSMRFRKTTFREDEAYTWVTAITALVTMFFIMNIM